MCFREGWNRPERAKKCIEQKESISAIYQINCLIYKKLFAMKIGRMGRRGRKIYFYFDISAFIHLNSSMIVLPQLHFLALTLFCYLNSSFGEHLTVVRSWSTFIVDIELDIANLMVFYQFFMQHWIRLHASYTKRINK